MSETAGTTRDRQYGKCLWNGREFSLVDTGGWVVKSDDIFEDAIRKQVRVATDEADLVLFVVDNETGITDWDEDVAQILRRASVPILLVANKIDNSGRSYEAAEFYKLGLGDPICVSAITGGGTGDLLDIILEKLEDVPEEEVDDNLPRFAVVGRPQCRQVEHHQRLHRRGPQHRHRDSRNHTRQHLHALQQVWLRLLPRRYGRHPTQKQGERGPGVL